MTPSRLRRYGWPALLAVIVLPFVLFAVPQVLGATGSYVVVSNSMTPHLHSGDAVFVYDVPPERIEPGDVLTYRQPSGRQIATHQVVEVVERDGQRRFRTKGTANEDADPYLVPQAAVIGIVGFHVPLIGLAVSWLGTGYGIFLFIVVPSFLLIVTELWGLGEALRVGRGERTERAIPDPDPADFMPDDGARGDSSASEQVTAATARED